MNKALLIDQLKIDRGDHPRPGGRSGRGGRLWAAGGLALVGLGLATWFLLVRPDLPFVATTAALTLPTGPRAQGGSLLEASGYVVARRASTVSSKITGKVAEVLIEEGQHVAQGQVIARLDDSNAKAALDQARARVMAAFAAVRLAGAGLESAEPRYIRSQKLHQSGFLSDQAVEEARAAADAARYNLDLAKRQMDEARAAVEVTERGQADTIIRAPFAGVVTTKDAQPGEMVSPVSAGSGFTRTGIGTIVDMGSLEVEVDVAESYINRVSQGMPATVKLNAYPDWEIPAEVIAVIPTANRSKATVSVRVALKAKDPRIVPDMGVRVTFMGQPAVAVAGAASRDVTVPAGAIRMEGDHPAVFIVTNGRAERRPVRLGLRRAGGQVVAGGVRPGERVVVEGPKTLRDGQRVKVKTAKSGQPDPGQGGDNGIAG